MQVRDIGLGVKELVPRRFGDARGFFSETWQRGRFHAAGIVEDWVQDNHSLSVEANVLRGLHFQKAPFVQAKLIRVVRGSVFDVAVDLRPGSDSFGKWVSCVLSSSTFNQLYIPEGFAHGFLTLEPEVEVLYKVSAPYAPDCERSIIWNDEALAVKWPLVGSGMPLLSTKDSQAPSLSEILGELIF